MRLNPITNTSYQWKWINSLLTGAVCMQRLYLSEFDPAPLLEKKDLLYTYKGCLSLACTAFEKMQLPDNAVEIAERIEIEQGNAFKYAQLAASNPESPLASFNAVRASQSLENVKILTLQLRHMCNESIR